MPPTSTARISTSMWLVMAALAFTGQIAWAVENSWFNTFVYDTITPDPRPLALTFDQIMLEGINRVAGKTKGGKPLTFIPYFLWGNRGPSQMNVWINQ
jgi:Glycoside hydrolase family 127 C-terminal domain